MIRASDSLPSGRSKGVFIFTLSSPDFCELLAQGYFSSLVLVTPFVLPPSVPLLPSPSPPGSRFRAGEDRGEGKGGGVARYSCTVLALVCNPLFFPSSSLIRL